MWRLMSRSCGQQRNVMTLVLVTLSDPCARCARISIQRKRSHKFIQEVPQPRCHPGRMAGIHPAAGKGLAEEPWTPGTRPGVTNGELSRVEQLVLDVHDRAAAGQDL